MADSRMEFHVSTCDDCPLLREDDRNGLWCGFPTNESPQLRASGKRIVVKRGRCPLRDGCVHDGHHARHPMTAAHDPQQWRIAVSLGLACGLDWARWAAGHTGWCGRPSCPCDFDGQCGCISAPVPAPWDADAYRADCARRGVEPGMYPTLSFIAGAATVSVGEGFGGGARVNIVVGSVIPGGHVRAQVGSEGTVYVGAAGRCMPDDLTRLAELARVAADAMREPPP